jgi:hypothetical protein
LVSDTEPRTSTLRPPMLWIGTWIRCMPFALLLVVGVPTMNAAGGPARADVQVRTDADPADQGHVADALAVLLGPDHAVPLTGRGVAGHVHAGDGAADAAAGYRLSVTALLPMLVTWKFRWIVAPGSGGR